MVGAGSRPHHKKSLLGHHKKSGWARPMPDLNIWVWASTPICPAHVTGPRFT